MQAVMGIKAEKLVTWALTCVLIIVQQCTGQQTSARNLFVERLSRVDGWYNNLDHPDWGTPGTGLTRKTGARYADGVNKPVDMGLPNPKEVSDAMFKGESSTQSEHSVFFAYFGQHLVDDMIDTRSVTCPNEYINIKFYERKNGSRVGGQQIMPVYRSKYQSGSGSSTNAPRILTNDVTAWLDGSVIYGASNSWTQHLRSYRGGRLKEEDGAPGIPSFNRNEIPLYNPTIDRERPPKTRNPEELFSFGNRRGNESPFLISVGILWFRWHNYLADKFARENPSWNDQRLFNTARRWTVATFQKIVMYDWLNEITGETLPRYNITGYNSFLDPGISVEFSTAAMRMGHSLIPSGVVLRDPETCNPISPLPSQYGASAGESALRLCNSYFALQDAIVQNGIDDIMLGMTSQAAENGDRLVVEDLTEFTYGPLKRTRMDLEALTIQRGRDAGVASYNNARKAYGLNPVSTFAEINPDLPGDVVAKLAELYNNDTERVDMYVGGMMEKKQRLTGELFTMVIKKQFERTRNSDRFWFENVENSQFTEQEVNEILDTTIRDIVEIVTGIQNNTLQPNLFKIEGSRCPHIRVTRSNFTKPCTPNVGIDFFEGFWGKYVGVVILLLLFPTVAYFIMCIIAWKRQRDTIQIKKSLVQVAKQSAKNTKQGTTEGDVFPAFEIEGKSRSRRVLLVLDGTCITLLSISSAELRKICVAQFKKSYIFISRNKKRDIFVIRIPKEYDVVLRFTTGDERDAALRHVQTFMKENHIQTEVFEMDESALREEAVTKEARQSLLESFFRRAFSEVLHLENSDECKKSNKKDDSKKTRHRTMEIADCELTQTELAETMGMKPNSLFVQQMFQLADTDNSGYLSFREFADLVILLMNGSPEQKAQMLFDMYDVDHSGELNREEGTNMIRSFLEMAGAKVGANDIDAAVETIFKEAGVGQDKDCLTLEDFTYVMLKEHRDAFEGAQLSIPGYTRPAKRRPIKSQGSVTNFTPSIEPKSELRKRNGTGDSKETINEETEKKVFSEAAATEEEKTWWGRYWKSTKRYVENYRRHILCMVVFYGITIALMVERAIFYAFGAEHQGIRRVTEWGIIISRSTAAAMSFHYSFILLTMSRNLITFCRETFLKNIIPFDSAVAFHKQIAYVALVETILHVFGHLVNIYHFSVHPLPVLACLFPKLFVDDGSDLPKSVTWWVFETIPGMTGVLLLLTIAIIYVFAMQFSRRFCFRAFWITHHMYTIMYVLVILHGSMAIVQSPVFHFYLVVPAVIFFVDKMITIGRSKVEIKVVKAEALPSGVTNLVFKRPTAFDYRSGQWVKIASLALGPNEYHPFTLTSAPHERYLSLHIRSVGPWTTNLRNLYQGAIDSHESLPNLYLDGPFGEGHQDWYKHDVAVLVGAGIGVTPFASILKDIVNRTRTDKGFQITCKKVYFVWVTRTQRHFEWLTDIIKDLEESEGGDLVSTHIYITQFANKFDLRTTMLYICERYFQKVANKSMFTGLKATTHFGRPQFELFLNSLQTMHSDVRRFGVFSCGPPGLTNGVEDACKQVNKMHKARFSHFYENF